MSISSVSLASFYAQLASFANLANFWSLFDTAFGSSYDFAIAASFRSQWQSQNFSQLPQLEIISSGVLGKANGAYSISTNRIYLSDKFLATANPTDLVAVILEEIGHFIDAKINKNDRKGDEGELFSQLVRGVKLSAAELTRIQTENDHAIVTIGVKTVAIEQSLATTGLTSNFNVGLSSSQLGISLPQSSLQLATNPSQFSISLPANFLNLAGQFTPPSSNTVINVNYTGFTPQAQTAFQFAVDVWEGLLNTSVPITVDASFSNLGANILGSAGPKLFYRDFTGATQVGTWYPVALANSLARRDLDTSNSDINAQFSNAFNWYYGTDGNVPSNQISFVSVVLHELGHGLGFTGLMQHQSGRGSWGYNTGLPGIYDRFTESSSGQSLINTSLFPNPSNTLGSQLTSNNIYFDGKEANAANGGDRVKLYAPSTWTEGSSYYHLDEIFNNTPDALMTYSIGYGESILNPGPITLGLLKDMGWKLVNDSSTETLITLSLSPSRVLEDGTNNLVYTFSRSGGSLTTALSVNYVISGTAASGSDYNTIASNIIFAANSRTATLAINPIADALVEPDETIILTLELGPGYSIGTTSAVTGTITNDDIAIETAGNVKLLKDGGNKYFAQVGTATPIAIKNGGQIYQDIYSSSWQTLAVENVNGENQILWKNVTGNYLHIWKMDRNWNWVSAEGRWALNSTEVFNQEIAFGVDANGDTSIGNPYTSIESAGNTKLLQDDDNKYFAQVGTATPIAIKNGVQIYQDIYSSSWQTLAVENVNGENQVLWKNVTGNSLHIWKMDGNWNWVSAEGQWALNSTEAFNQETAFGVDANGDASIGNPYTSIQSAGNTKLLKDGGNKYFAQVGTATPIAIKNGGQIYQDIYSSSWQTLAVENINGENQVFWKNVTGNYLHIWKMDSNWNWVSVEGQWAVNSTEAFNKETLFGVDANADGFVGNSVSLNLSGTSGKDTLIGGAKSDVLKGLGGKDLLTGGLGRDRFNYTVLTDSLLANFDVITDFNANASNDLLLVTTARSSFTNAGAVATLDNRGIIAKLNTTNFGINAAAQFTFGTRFFVAINDGRAGFSQTTDAIIEITGLKGTLGLTNFVTV